MDNHKSRADAFSTFSPFKSRLSRFVQEIVYGLSPDRDPQIRDRGFLHFAFWTTVRHRDLKEAGVPDTQNPKHGALLFTSVFNGKADEYVAGFSKHLHREMDALWGECEGWKGAEPLENLDAFIEENRRRVNLFFNAYRDDARGIRSSLLLRRKLDALADVRHTKSARELSDRLATLARSLEGSA